MKLAKRLSLFEESKTIAMARRVRELINEGKSIVSLTLGEPDFDTPQHIKEAAFDAINNNITHYPPVPGFPELRSAIAEKFHKENNLNWKTENIVVSTGAKQALYNTIMSLINSGDEAVLIAPYWVTYAEILKMAGAKLNIISTTVDEDYKVSAEKLDATLNQNTKLIVINSPSNPSGATYTKSELEKLVKVIEKYPNLIIVSDEIYELITFEDKYTSIGSFESIENRVVTINGFSKGYAMTGWRLGYIGAPEWIAKACTKLQGQITSGANSITQYAAVAALTQSNRPSLEMTAQFKKRVEFAYKKLSEIPNLKVNLPNGAFYLYPNFGSYLNKVTENGTRITQIEELCKYLLEEGGVATVAGTAFGTEEHLRLSCASDIETLEEGIKRIADSLAKLH